VQEYALTLHLKVLLIMDEKDHLKTLSDIKNLMERSSRFLSLGGSSGILIGLYAIAGAVAASWYLSNQGLGAMGYYALVTGADAEVYKPFLSFLIGDASIVILLAIITAYIFTQRLARKQGLLKWDVTAKRMLINLLIPLVTGGFFCLILLQQNSFGLIAPSMLIFYGLALLNASKYTFNDIRALGITEIILGLTAAVNMGYGLLFWALGFGVMHIVYGITMYYKYER
jgi:hypothetical protein